MGIDWGFNLRDTAAFVTDQAGEIFVGGPGLGAVAYPTTASGRTFGWSGGAAAVDSRDRSASVDRRLAGLHGQTGVFYFQIDLPNAMTADVYLALGDQQNSRPTISATIKDGTTTLATISDATGTAADHYDDANGTDFTSTTWPTSNQPKRVTLLSTSLRIELEDANTTITHIRVVEVPAGVSGAPQRPIALQQRIG